MGNTAVVLVNYNGLEDTKACIESILKSSIECSIVVIDNASKEDDGSKINQFNSNITVIRNSDNLGFAGANNVGILWALEHDFEYILLLNNDTVVDRDMIRLLLEETNEETVAVPAMYYFSAPKELWYGGGKINRYTGNCEHLNLDHKQQVSFATGCCMLLSREVINKAGLLDERYFMYCEDLDYSIRLAKKHIKILYIPEAKLYHKVGRTSGGSGTPFSDYYITRNRLNCIRQHSDCFTRFAYPFSLISRYIRAMEGRVRKREFKAFLEGIKDHKNDKWGRNPNY